MSGYSADYVRDKLTKHLQPEHFVSFQVAIQLVAIRLVAIQSVAIQSIVWSNCLIPQFDFLVQILNLPTQLFNCLAQTS